MAVTEQEPPYPKAAYAYCQAVTRSQARNFYYGIRLLPAPKRRSLCALYAFARRVDDIGDGDLPAEEKLRQLERLRLDLRASTRGAGSGGRTSGAGAAAGDPVYMALAHTLSRYPVPPQALEELVDGCEMDCRGTSYSSIDDLVAYCRKVAGSIGRLSLGVFGSTSPDAPALADALGVALQLTNILRDLAEDRDEMGRTYLPASDIERFGCAPDLSGPAAALEKLVTFEAQVAEEWFATGLRLLPLLDARSRASAGAMAGIYHRLLAKIEREPWRVRVERVSLPAPEKAAVAAGSLLTAFRQPAAQMPGQAAGRR
ncbi:MAG: phytoene/squalene synthase family protein [Acidimicrobiales bacterium]